jgi:hypothetical protein
MRGAGDDLEVVDRAELGGPWRSAFTSSVSTTTEAPLSSARAQQDLISMPAGGDQL